MQIVVTTTDNIFKVEFNDLAGTEFPVIGIIPICQTFQKRNIEFVLESDMVVANLVTHSKEYHISFDGSGSTIKIESVNAIVPTSNLDLFNILNTTLG